jgi:hypothetical protein
MTAGQSAAARARQLRRAHPWWHRLLTALGLRQPDPLAARYDAGAAGERRTAELLAPLAHQGWHILHDRAIPGSTANLDHILIPPHGQNAIVLDSKLWSRHQGAINVNRHRRLVHGIADRHSAVNTVQWEADRVSGRLVIPVYPVIVMHSAPVAGGELAVDGVMVVDPERLLSLLRVHAAADYPDRAGAARLAARVGQVFPPFA